MNFFSFTLSGKYFICPSILHDSFPGQSNLGCWFLLFITLNTSCQSLLVYKVSFEKPADSLMETPLQVTLCFSLATLKILFTFNLWHFNYDVCWCGPLCVPLVWDCASWTCMPVYFIKLGKFSFIIFFQISFQFLSLFPLAPL